MEALNAVSLAANILQFSIFAKDCYVELKEIHASADGLTKHNAKILEATSRTKKMLGSIDSGIHSLNGDTDTERQIRHVALECRRMTRELQEATENKALKNRSKRARVMSILKERFNTSEVNKKLDEWEHLKNDLSRLLNVYISEQQHGLEDALASLADQTRRLGMAHSNDLERMESNLLNVFSRESESREAALDVSMQLVDWTEKVDSLKKEHAVLQSLHFDRMMARRDDIVKAEPDTFQWVEKPNLSFLEWLSDGDGVYWVTGDPGSGKSTLMKYLSHHTTTKEKLEQWAAPKTLVRASFYFWFSGTDLQKSQEGLLRSLLFEILRRCPYLIPRVCQSRWSSDLTVSWHKSELMKTLKSLTPETTSHKFFFLIDGLDEYQDSDGLEGGNEGEVAAHVSDIIGVINDLANLEDIKLCVSSRPWPAFEKAFGQETHRKLYVHEENRDDISRYVQQRFLNSLKIRKSSISHEDMQQLSKSIVDDSRGVFFWVFLVVESLLRGLGNRDGIEELRQRLERTPKRLRTMFQRMLDSVEGIYHKQAAQTLQVASHARAPLPVAIYSFIGKDNLSFTGDPEPWDENKCLRISEDTERRLKVRCPDLIKIKGIPSDMTTAQQMMGHQVEFLHRTVKDFLSLEETQKMLRDRIKEPFDPMEFISKALLAHIRGAKNSEHKAWTLTAREMFQLLDEITYYLSELERLADPQLEQKTRLQLELLDKLHETITKQTGNNDFLLNGDSFVGVIAQRDMYLYVRRNLSQALHGPGVPLLKSVLFPQWQRPLIQADGLPHPSVKMVELLLKPGGKRRELSKQEKKEIWAQYMTRIYKAREELKSNADLKETHIEIIRMLLEHGADRKIECVVGRKDPVPTVGKARGIGYLVKMNIQSILEEVFEPGERKSLELLLRPKWKGWVSSMRVALRD